jgi:hypothetical protein
MVGPGLHSRKIRYASNIRRPKDTLLKQREKEREIKKRKRDALM